MNNHKKIDFKCHGFFGGQRWANWLDTVHYTMKRFLPECSSVLFMNSCHTPHHAPADTTFIYFFIYTIKGKKKGFIMALLSPRIL